jgi:hypothetical protein
LSQNIQLVTMCAGIVIPAVVGLITSTKASAVLQTSLSALMSVIVGVVSAWAASGMMNWTTAILAVMTTFISTLVLAHSLYHQTGATTKIQEVTDGIAVDKVIAKVVGSAT